MSPGVARVSRHGDGIAVTVRQRSTRLRERVLVDVVDRDVHAGRHEVASHLSSDAPPHRYDRGRSPRDRQVR